MSRKVLIITYYFPPRQHVASLRLRGLAKYLPEFGWEPVVLTAKLPGAPPLNIRVVETFYPGDATALFKKKLHMDSNKGFQEQVGIPLKIREGKNSLSSKVIKLIKGIIAYPDEQRYWYSYAIEKVRELFSNEKFDAIISSSSPVTTHLIAREIKKRDKNIKWIADLRDLWTQNHYYSYGFIRKFFERKLEINTLKEADALVTVSLPLAEELEKLHNNKVFVITNGFDPDEIVKNADVTLTDSFSITYTGQLYQGKRDPSMLFRAIRELADEGRIDLNKVEIRFFGPIQYWVKMQAEKYGLDSNVKLLGVVPREESLKRQRESQILLLLNWNDPRERGVYTGKIFEYLAAKRPILSVGGLGGVVAELLNETEAGIHTRTMDNLKNVLRKWFEEFSSSGYVKYRGKREKMMRYSHVKMAKKFAELMDNLL